MKKKIRKMQLYMDTLVEIQVISSSDALSSVEQKMDSAFAVFGQVEAACSRFSPDSEAMRACQQVNLPVPVSPFLFEPLKFAIEMAKRTDGVFDPTVGRLMEEIGFRRHYLTGQMADHPLSGPATFHDICLDEQNRAVLLKKPLVIDLGAVAKGFAIDLAAKELSEFDGFVVNAGGDLYAGGLDEAGNPWRIGIRHPVEKDRLLQTIEISNAAVCTSGSYERKSSAAAELHHLIHPKTGQSPNDWISCSVVAPFAMMADAFATAAFLLGFEKGKRLLQEEGLEAVLVTPCLEIEKVAGEFVKR